MTRIALRNAWFQAHKYIGLLLAVAIIPISLTGSALVWHDALDEALNPQRVVTGEAMLPASRYAASAAAALAPGERISNLRFEEDGPVVATAARPPVPGARGRPERTLVWLDPATGRVLDKAGSSDGLVRVMHVLHGSLMVPGVGRQIVGWIGVAMLISAISGIWLWWPTVGRLTKGLRWRRHRDFDTNLHHQMGFWIALPLFVLSLTGVWISFPPFFAALSGAPQQQQRGDPGARFRAQPLATTVQNVDGAVAKAAGTPVSIAWPTDQKAEWTISVKAASGPPSEVTIEDATGVAKRGEARPGGQSEIARTMRKIHDGTDMGLLWQVIIFIGGILPAALAITGIIMWIRARRWRGALAARPRGKPLPAE